ncbi:sugar transferase [Abyssibius alkaniclasticus]|uniref:sugar transferase n=1 Tax=Abyssibius alkaniclasticus TaxID=2881234 RepID=UPI002364215C|nr:sugar transferase [Abyssibius alkaniclasticus]UPH70243.1 sugar transferase [Abyssibius alkaniclasticus]
MPKRVIITGASGFIGMQIVPRLVSAGFELLLVGRNPDKLSELFPGVKNCSYSSLAEAGQGFELLLHLAVLNNNALSNADEYQKVNVNLLEQTLATAKRAGVSRFVNITTFHALDEHGSEYARSKRAALDILKAEENIAITNVFLPAVYGDEFVGKLSIVKKVPALLRPAALTFLTALLPTVHVDELARVLATDIGAKPQSIMLAYSQDQNIVYRIGKRLIDVLFSVAVITLAGWILAIVWVLVRLGSSGPGIFAQERVGQNGKTFTCYKFRTMKTGTKQAGTHEMTADAITGIGAFLRKTKIDELPQVWNILRGELSLVGPRPGLPVQTKLTDERQAHGVFSVLPGITGLAQINGVDMSDPERLARMDAKYIAQRGLLLDLKIVLATFLGRGQGDKVRA